MLPSIVLWNLFSSRSLSALEAEMVFIRNLVGGLLAEPEDDIDRDKFKRLLHYPRRLTSFQNRAKLVSRRLTAYQHHRVTGPASANRHFVPK